MKIFEKPPVKSEISEEEIEGSFDKLGDDVESGDKGESLLERYKVKQGDKIRVQKVFNLRESKGSVGTELEGTLDLDLAPGAGISLDGGRVMVSNVEFFAEDKNKAGESTGSIFFQTTTSVYELFAEEVE